MASLFGPNPFSTPVGQRIDKATDGNLPSEDWAANIDICDIINETEEGPKDAAKAIRKRLAGNKNFKSVLLTLTVLETCVKNCGHRFHVLIAKKDFLDELVKILGSKNNPPQIVQDKILSLIQDWADAFRGSPELTNVLETYESLRAQGLEFPAKNLDTLSPIYTPQRTQPERPAPAPSRPPPIQPPVPLPFQSVPPMQAPSGPVVPTPEQLGKIRSELDIVNGNINVMSEMLTEMTPGQEEAGDLQLLQELNRTCRSMQQRVLELIERVANEEVVGMLLSVNDDLNNVFIRYDRYERFRQAVQQQSQPSEAPPAPPRPAPVEPLPVQTGRATTAWPENSHRLPGTIEPSQPQLPVAIPAPAAAALVAPVAPAAPASAAPAPAGGDSLISFDDDTPTPSQAASVNSVTSQVQAMNMGTTSADQDDEEFDMFAQSRKTTFDESRKGGSSYTDNLQPFDRSIGNTISIQKTDSEDTQAAKTEERSAMDDIESWLDITEKDVAEAAAGQPNGDTLSSSEFDQFLADRAAAGGMRSGSVKGGNNRPRQRQMQMENQADDEMFGL
ncbi:TOM1-like protein 2 [Stylophora pistillata]|uniref:TOM1-like protein 2 n=1 Tax=Stylophora pistillata TaxID=50429 RepID=A0A2B4SKC6_STYPI|nr:TOM1-like protein 2 [Stylophora pistillata]PFX29028.1 TOM1-like protein 2 [Stylophora pistillata]